MVNGLEGVILDQANGCRKFDNSRLSHQSVQPWLPRKTDITDIVVLVEGGKYGDGPGVNPGNLVFGAC